MDEQLTIGVFARRCGLSRSALRFYDECGLLQPAAVDEVTGYRYYRSAQLEQADLIRRLRGAELPVEGVRAFLEAGLAERQALLDAHLAVVERRLSAVRGAAGELRAELRIQQLSGTASCALSGQMLATALGQVLFAAAAQADLPALTGVLLETKDDSLRLVATDRHRLAVRDIVPDRPVPVRPLRALVSAAALAELQGKLTGIDSCALWPGADGGLRADLDGTSICLAPVTGPFPDYEQVLLGVPAGHHGLVGRAALADAFDGLDHPTAELTFARTELLVRAGQRTAAVGARWDGPDLTMTINPVFVAQALAAQVGPDVAIEATDSLRPITFRSADAGTLSVLVMPIRAEA